MSQLVPRKYCMPGQNPRESPEPCVPVGETIDLKATSVFIVSMEGDIWLEGEDLDENAEPMAGMPGKYKEH